MAELRAGVLSDVGLHLHPVAVVLAHLLAARADGDDAAQRADLVERPVELLDEPFALLFHALAPGNVHHRGLHRGCPFHPDGGDEGLDPAQLPVGPAYPEGRVLRRRQPTEQGPVVLQHPLGVGRVKQLAQLPRGHVQQGVRVPRQEALQGGVYEQQPGRRLRGDEQPLQRVVHQGPVLGLALAQSLLDLLVLPQDLIQVYAGLGELLGEALSVHRHVRLRHPAVLPALVATPKPARLVVEHREPLADPHRELGAVVGRPHHGPLAASIHPGLRDPARGPPRRLVHAPDPAREVHIPPPHHQRVPHLHLQAAGMGRLVIPDHGAAMDRHHGTMARGDAQFNWFDCH